MRAREVTLAAGGLCAGAAVLGVAGALLERARRTSGEIERYADDILAAGEAIRANLQVTDEAVSVRDAVARLRSPAGGAGTTRPAWTTEAP